jgi:lipoprotein NlpD
MQPYRRRPQLRAQLAVFACIALLAACTTTGPSAPVQERTERTTERTTEATRRPPPAAPAAPIASRTAPVPLAPAASNTGPAPAPLVEAAPAISNTPLPTGPGGRPLFHVVKRGDTLYAVALEHGQDYRDVIRWNGIDNANLIYADQILRIAPPEIAAAPPGSSDVVAQSAPVNLARVEQRPLAGAPAAATTTGRVPLKTGPAGEKRPWSERVWSDLSRAEGGAEAAPAAPPPAVVGAAAAADADGLGWIWPVPGKPVEEFNEARSKGIDILGRAGDAVSAAADGQVVYAGSGLRGYGNLVIIKHNNDYLSAYAHNRVVLVKEQQAIKKGQKIAEMGSSDTDKVKLHFEIRRQGRPVDPLKFLPERR